MPIFENNGNSITIPKWLLPIVIVLFLTGLAGWGTVSFQARGALSREDAYRNFTTIEQHDKSYRELNDHLTRMDEKLDRLLQQ